jgi:hypothetical protein
MLIPESGFPLSLSFLPGPRALADALFLSTSFSFSLTLPMIHAHMNVHFFRYPQSFLDALRLDYFATRTLYRPAPYLSLLIFNPTRLIQCAFSISQLRSVPGCLCLHAAVCHRTCLKHTHEAPALPGIIPSLRISMASSYADRETSIGCGARCTAAQFY